MSTEDFETGSPFEKQSFEDYLFGRSPGIFQHRESWIEEEQADLREAERAQAAIAKFLSGLNERTDKNDEQD